jgi:hypothetical protein
MNAGRANLFFGYSPPLTVSLWSMSGFGLGLYSISVFDHASWSSGGEKLQVRCICVCAEFSDGYIHDPSVEASGSWNEVATEGKEYE